MDARFVFAQLKHISSHLQKPTVIVLDNASINKAKIMKQQLPYWENRGLYTFYLPAYSSCLNLDETRWRKKRANRPERLRDEGNAFLCHESVLGAIWKRMENNVFRV